MPITDIYMAGDINYRSRGAALAPRGRNCSRAFSAHFPANLLDSRLRPPSSLFLFFFFSFARERGRETSLLATPMNHASRPRFFRLNRDAWQKIAVLFVFPFFIRRLISTTLENKLLLKRACRFLENEIVRGRPECKQSYQRLFFSSPSLHIKLSLKECWLSLVPSQSSTCIIHRH